MGARVPVGAMGRPRWYPSVVTLSDGRAAAISGLDDTGNTGSGEGSGLFVREIDVYDPSSQSWTLFTPDTGGGGESVLPHTYPFMFTFDDTAHPNYPDGQSLFFAGPATATQPPESVWSLETYVLRITGMGTGTSGEWKALGGNSGIQGSGAVIWINGTDPIDRGTVFKFGGIFGNNPSVVTARGRKINLHDGQQAIWVDTADMKKARTDCDFVWLPDGRVCAVGGSTSPERPQLKGTAVLEPEYYNPEKNVWTLIPFAMTKTRMYH